MLRGEEAQGPVDVVGGVVAGHDVAEAEGGDDEFVAREEGEADVEGAWAALLEGAGGEVGGMAEVEGGVLRGDGRGRWGGLDLGGGVDIGAVFGGDVGGCVGVGHEETRSFEVGWFVVRS